MDSFQNSSSSVDIDDNAFYQELTRQILMLTDENDDDKVMYTNGVVGRPRPMVRPVARNSYYSWSETERSSVPRWMESLWDNGGGGGGGGTGVFIPTGVATRGHGKKSGRRRYNNKVTKSNDRGRVYSTPGQKIHG